MPYKFKNKEDKIFIELNKLSKEHKKSLWCFFNDDYDKLLYLDKNVKLFRTSFYKSSQLSNEFALPTLSADFFNNIYITNNKLSIGYCGHTKCNRKYYIDILEKSNLETNFILRKGCRATEIKEIIAKKEFIKNMEDNIFIFCYRGVGNFSYRFYEILMMGRIPILINTDCVFPFENKININSLGLIINENDIKNKKVDLIEKITNYYNTNDLLKIQKRNRFKWKKYFSSTKFVNKLINNYK